MQWESVLNGSLSNNLNLYLCVAGPQQEEVELGGGGGDVLTTVCDHLSPQQLNTEVRAPPPPTPTRQTDTEDMRQFNMIHHDQTGAAPEAGPRPGWQSQHQGLPQDSAWLSPRLLLHPRTIS